MARVTRTIVALAAVVMTAAACSSAADDNADAASGSTSESAGVAPPEAQDDAGGEASPDDTGSNADSSRESIVSAALQTAAGRDIIHTVSLAIDTTDVGAAARDAATVAVAAGGFVADETLRGDEHADLTLKIPVDAHAEALGDLERLGTVVDRTRTTDDVTDKVVDTESRIATQQASIARTRQLLETATDIDQIIRIEDELSSREADLDALLRTREELSALSSLATVHLTLTDVAEEEPETVEATGFVAGLHDGWDAFTDAATVATTIIGTATPFLVVMAAVGLPLLWWRRRRRPAMVD